MYFGSISFQFMNHVSIVNDIINYKTEVHAAQKINSGPKVNPCQWKQSKINVTCKRHEIATKHEHR